jgi:hypothetical protein
MRPLVVITPAKVYMDVWGAYRSRGCLVRPNVGLNGRNLNQRELSYASRYLNQEGWLEYADGTWKPDPELTRFMDESLGR